MSLSVDVFVVGADGERQVQDVPDGCSDCAGFESWRTRVWGAEVVRSLGAVFLPILAEGDLQVEPGQVPAFLRECLLLRENLERIAADTEPVRTTEEHRDTISERLAIIEAATRRASAMGGGVLIW
ncbi:hypothetical protein [Streptomyces albipurpureus]|uniref:Uncharacterized protein n=1 Tax=Streptomyces albipurpureus TaxID=2897419 RepID=A0ABT0UL50_9ACTN|nr:hypothetical protein [Streptomyces sp. CWNU-1]MCM2388345.1 hypothetical protein [Streptomyces sp. CWNU-1]